ncbi:MAG: alpha/beta fold hydrolase [Limnohabitans sp.]|nr:alpha/beta fold hydrolase [Limnohabitans sp.]
MKIVNTYLLLLLTNICFGQTDFKQQFKMFSLEDKKLGKVEFCTFNSTIDKKKPLMIFIHGSGNLPTFHYIPSLKNYSWSSFSEVQNYKDNYHVIFVNKPSVPLFDTVQGENGNYSYSISEDFNQKYSLEWRAKATSLIINQATKLLPVDQSKIVVIGHSQGGQVAPKVALINKKVTHVVLLNSNSLNHLYDFTLQERLASFKGEQSYEQTQQNIDSLFSDYKRIFSDPNNVTKTWNNETYFRWASFSDETPLENMLKLKIPIYVIAGGKDLWGSFIMNTDYVQIEFLRYKKTNLTYLVYPNANHFLQDEITENGKINYINIKPKIFKNIDEWTNK